MVQCLGHLARSGDIFTNREVASDPERHVQFENDSNILRLQGISEVELNKLVRQEVRSNLH